MQTIGERLEEARKRKGISIREAAEATKIRGDYLHKFESNQFDIRLPEIYVRGFLRTYAGFLKLPAEKIVNDYQALGLGEIKSSRQLNREVYGRMDLSVSTAKGGNEESRPEAPQEHTAAAGESGEARNPATFRPRSSDTGSPVDKTLLIKAGALVGAAVLLILLIVWVVSALVSTKPASEVPRSATVQPVENSIALIALQPMRIKVARRSDDSELFQSQVAAGFRREFPETPLYVTSTALESVQIEYKGVRYNIGTSGYGKVAIDPANLK